MIALNLQPRGMTRGELEITAAYLEGLASLRPLDAGRIDDDQMELPLTPPPIAVPGGTGGGVAGTAQPDSPSDCEPPCGHNAGSGVDADGFPWDARIHASSQALNADGTWRRKRGVEDALVSEVTAELRGAVTPPTILPVPPPPTVPPAPAVTFASIMPRVTAALQNGSINVAQVASACQGAGIPALPALAGMPHLIPQVLAALGIDHE